jgi:hypothetical protein
MAEIGTHMLNLPKEKSTHLSIPATSFDVWVETKLGRISTCEPAML